MHKPILPILWLAVLLASGGRLAAARQTFNSYDQAKLHPLSSDRPAPDFFAGALLGNGAMGVWFENFALPVVVDECLMQSYQGTIRLFPNWPRQQDAEFHHLQAAGAFLVSAALKDGKVRQVEITSEVGGRLRIISPWEEGATAVTRAGQRSMRGGVLEFATAKGEVIVLRP